MTNSQKVIWEVPDPHKFDYRVNIHDPLAMLLMTLIPMLNPTTTTCCLRAKHLIRSFIHWHMGGLVADMNNSL